jgi:predicted NACHT family NTPase
LLVEKAGAGKTTTFRNIAKKIKSGNPSCWVSYIDLKRCIESYEQALDLFNLQSVDTFIAKVILELNPVDEHVFLELYQVNRVILLFDGFDEICPRYNEFMMKIFESIQSSSLNHIWVSSRPLDVINLEKKLNCIIYKFNPFTKDSRRDFIEKFFARQRLDPSIEQIDRVYKDVISFIGKIEKCEASSSFKVI